MASKAAKSVEDPISKLAIFVYEDKSGYVEKLVGYSVEYIGDFNNETELRQLIGKLVKCDECGNEVMWTAYVDGGEERHFCNEHYQKYLETLGG